MGIDMASGRDFSRDIPSDSGRAYILNETAVKELDLASPLGRQFKIIDKGTIIGVVKDFHFDSLHRRIEPLALCVYPAEFQNLSVRVRPGRTDDVLRDLKALWKRFAPETPLDYSFLDEDFDKLYKADLRLNRIFLAAAGASILVAGLGLYGLASLTAKRRTKEIGIRKILGASVTGLTIQLSRQFISLVALANIFAWPIAYYALGRWLEGFAYRTSLSVRPFLLSAFFALAASLLAVGWQTVQSARSDPVKSLRCE